MIPELNKIHHGDCLEIMKTWPDKFVDCVVTSPPYNQLGSRIPKNATGMHKDDGWINKVNRNGYGDDMEEGEYQLWQKNVIAELRRICKGTVWYNHKIRYRDGFGVSPAQWLPMEDMFAEIIWDRGGSMVLNAKRFAPSYETIYGIGRPHYWSDDLNTMMTVWRMAAANGIDGHPCPFPVDIPSRLIKSSCPPGGIVFDPFFGSGTTGVAAESLGMKWIGTEISQDYIEVAMARIGLEQSQGKMF
jgi:DNA modification methylase